ncbi:MAG: hypothetical protein QOI63_836 [Thermoplasmata archaeon]|jgi:hypothetical protein|nr:hypothetical protein [Thermoplasmata archaeon]
MLEKKDVERITVLARRAKKGTILPAEQEEMRRLLAQYSPKVWELPSEDLLHVAYFFLGIYSIAELAQSPVPADVS